MISSIFIKRPVTAIVISLVIVIVGTLALSNLPISQYPEITPPQVQITGSYVGADAQTVEQNVVTPIETQVNGTPGMSYLQSSSTNSGSFTINAYFNIGTNINIATLDVQNRVSIAQPVLPAEVKQLGVITRKRNPAILMLVAIFAPKSSHNVQFLDNYANIYVKDPLGRVDGVGDIITRTDDFSMRLWLQPDKMAALRLTAGDIVNALNEQNLQVAAGSIGSPPQKGDQSFEYTVLVNARLSKPEEFRRIIVKSNPATGSIVYLKDVANVELGKFNYSNNSFVDGRRASYLLVYQAPGSNSLKVAEGIYKQMEELKKSFPTDVDYVIPFEGVSVVQVSISEVVKTLVIALLLVTLVVYIFLQNWRATLIPVLAIPVSIIGTFMFFIPLGFTINTLTLFGFVLAIGIVVDDAIVVVEAVQHYMDTQKLSAREATEKAMADISAPVIAIALILAAVFVPVGFIPGIVGRLYQQFAITIAISVLLSAFIALSLTPALCSILLKERDESSKKNWLERFFDSFNNWFERMSSKYTIGVKHSISGARYIIILLISLSVAAIFMFRSKPSGFIPTEDEGRIFITYELPEGASTSRSLFVLRTLMKKIDSIKAVGHYAALGGLNVVTFASKSNSGTVFVQLKPWDQRTDKKLQLKAVIAEMVKSFSSLIDANVVVIPPPPIPGLGQTAGFTFEIEQKASNSDLAGMQQNIQSFTAAINKRPEIGRAFTFFNARNPVYRLTVDREQCRKLGVNIKDVFQTLQVYLGSSYINDFTLYGRTFRVVAQADSSYRADISQLGYYYVRNQAGTMLPLKTLISYRLEQNAPLISHYNLFRSVEFNGTPKPGFSSGEAIEALKETAAKTLPSSYTYEFSGLSREEIASGSSSIYIFGLSILFVFLFLAALYESWAIPFSVLLAVPIGAFGAILTLSFLPSLDNNVYAQIGLITLIGLAAKNAILIVEFAKERVDNGIDVIEATLDAVHLRLRPIIMTSLAFILGVSPLTFAEGAGAIARQTLGFTVLGGMIAATSIAIFIVPVLFVLIVKIAYGKKKLSELQSLHKNDTDKDSSDRY